MISPPLSINPHTLLAVLRTLDGFDVFFSTVFIPLAFQVVLQDNGSTVCCVDKVYKLLQFNTFIASRLIRERMNPPLKALDAFAEEADFQHTIEGQNRCGDSADEQETRKDLTGGKLRSVFVDNVICVPVHY